MKKQVRDATVFQAYKINDENDLDEMLTEVGEYDSIHRRDDYIKVSCAGTKLFECYIGDWVVVFSDRNIKNYNENEFNQNFYTLE